MSYREYNDRIGGINHWLFSQDEFKRNNFVQHTLYEVIRINNIRTHDDKSAINNLQIDVFYRLLKQVIQKLYPLTFDFEGRNMAVCVEDGCFDDRNNFVQHTLYEVIRVWKWVKKKNGF